MRVELKPGEEVDIIFEGTDGTITVGFDDKRIMVKVDLEDNFGRKGVIYDEMPDVPCIGDDVFFLDPTGTLSRGKVLDISMSSSGSGMVAGLTIQESEEEVIHVPLSSIKSEKDFPQPGA